MPHTFVFFANVWVLSAGAGQSYPYADVLALDVPPQGTNQYGLADFFNFNQLQAPTFQPMTPLEYGPTCFHNRTKRAVFRARTRKTLTTMPTKATE